MKGTRGWVIAAAVSVAIAAAAYLVQPHQDSPEHSSNSDAANGASAARLFAQSMGHPTDQIAGSFSLPAIDGFMFVLSPTSPFTGDEAERVLLWVRSGGTLIYASEQGDPQLDRVLGVTRFGYGTVIDHEVANEVVPGVGKVAGGALVTPLNASAEQVPFLRTPNGLVVGYLGRVAAGSVVVLADPLVICNGYLEKSDNGRMLADLLGLAGPTAPVWFDEYHHGLILSDFSPQAWLLTPWGAGLLWLLVAVFVGLVLRGRSFGPLIPRPTEVARTDVEWAVAVGQLLRRSSARSVTLGVLASATERAVAVRIGLPVQPRERFWNALWVRAPEIAADLADVENSLHASGSSEPDLLRTAQRLHRIAHPAPRVKS
ncbi:MAG TPA: DUF4350 domain-containing protein [Candidatus Dormibacteraeota bacterium]|nr:DUF4350 domain-containing protein [Candidatus Dormibacteraeota bacterium]